jgi:threonine dehydrogenase-like Zn-dependent dehydrogenase
MAHEQKSKRRLSRRQILRSGAAALGGTGALLAGTAAAAQNQAPAVRTGTQTGRTFRGLVRHDTTLDVQELVKLIERGKIDATSMITKRYTLENSRQAVQDTADRTIITGVIEFA